ncbi:MAG: O-antigen ligase family protein [Candidatus Levyibacteriota bacterium]
MLFLPTQFGRHFWPEFSIVSGLRIDYLSPTLHTTDVLIVSLFIFWLLPNLKKLKKLKIQTSVSIAVFIIFLALGIFLSISPPAAFYGFLKLSEFSFFGFYTAKNIKNLKTVIIPLSLGLFFEASLAIAQYLNYGSLGWIFYFFGERDFNSQTPGIANASLSGSLVLRPYGTFSHPNVLASYLVVSMTLIIFFFNKFSKNIKIAYALLLVLGSCALFATFSRTAILVWSMALVFWYVKGFEKYFKMKIAIPLIVLLSLAFYVFPLWARFSEVRVVGETVSNRLLLSKAAIDMFLERPILGTGIGNFLPNLPKYMESSGNIFYIQPVHNIFLLVLAELGIAGFLFFIWFLVKTYKKILLRKTDRVVFIILFAEVLTLGFFDHYFLTLQQGQLLFALSFGLFWSDTISKT